MIAKVFMGLSFLTLLAVASSGQAAQTDGPANKTPHTLTGCIHTGDAVSTYKLFTKDGVWNLSDASHKLKIGRQLDHTVTVRGAVVESFDKKPTDKPSNRRGVFAVTRVTMTGKSCRE